MRINGISNENKYNLHRPVKNQPTFEGYISAFSKRFDKVMKNAECSVDDSFYMYNQLNKIIKKRLKNTDVLGEGAFAKVLKIDSKYVLRMNNIQMFCVENFKSDYHSVKKDLGLRTYYGDYLAKFGDIQILRNVSSTGKHIPAGIPSKLLQTGTSEECDKYYDEVYLPKFANLPQKAYDNLANDFDILNLCYDDDWYRFDIFNPNNFVLVGKQIRIVDNITKESYNPNYLAPYSETLPDNRMSTTDLMRVFLMMRDLKTECSFNEKTLSLRRELFKKICLAGIKNQLPVVNDNNIYCFEKVAEVICNANCDSDKIIPKLEKFTNDYCENPKKTIKDSSLYIDSIFENPKIEIF